MSDHGCTENRLPMMENFPRIARARGYRLYGENGSRYIDFYQDGGRALLGHRPEGWVRAVKSTAARGLLAPYPGRFSGRARKAALSFFPWASDALVYPDLSAFSARYRTADPLVSPERELQREEVIPLWRPFGLDETGEKALREGRWGRWCVPLLPIPGGLGPVIVLEVTGESARSGEGVQLGESARPEEVPVSPLAEDLAVKALSGLQSYLDTAEKEMWSREMWSKFELRGITRQGPYFILEGAGEREYGALFRQMRDCGILLPPAVNIPAIIPAEFDEGEVKPLIRELRRHYADR